MRARAFFFFSLPLSQRFALGYRMARLQRAEGAIGPEGAEFDSLGRSPRGKRIFRADFLAFVYRMGMSQSLSNIVIHLTFSTKDRVRAIGYPDLREQTGAYITGILDKLGCPSIATCVVIDHVHSLFLLSRTEAISNVVQMIKQNSSAWLKQQKPEMRDPYLVKFSWQKGYAAFSVSESIVPKVKAYIENQEEHHKRMTFQDEYREFLKRHKVAFDEKYVWD